MFSLLEKLKYILATKFPLFRIRTTRSKEITTDGPLKRVVKKVFLTLSVAIILFIAIGLYAYYYFPPSVVVEESEGHILHSEHSPYMLRGRVISGIPSTLAIDSRAVELVDDDAFTYSAKLMPGDNRIVLEAKNKRGSTKEVYVVRYSPFKQPGSLQ